MKYIYLLGFVLFLSCGQNAKEKQTTTTDSVAVQKDSTTQEATDMVVEETATSPTFEKSIASTEVRSLPQMEITSFDSFIEAEDYKHVDAKALKLEQIYPDFNTVGYNYKAIASYRIQLSTDFHTVVVTIRKGDHEMESILINYSPEGTILAHQVVAYDEIAEGLSRTMSRISQEKLSVHHIYWDTSKEIEETVYRLLPDGTFEKIWSGTINDSIDEFVLIDTALIDLELNWVQIKTNLIATMEHPYNIDETIIVIPEIVDEAEQYFELNTHIVLTDSRLAEVSHRFFESAASNQWVSDAVELDEIRIDPDLYQISFDKEAYGIRVSYTGMSRANPYEHETLSLFMKFGNELKKVLDNYPVRNYGGEWNTDCEGEFELQEKTLSIDSTKHLSFYNLIINNQITATTNYVDSQGDCDYDEEVTNESLMLIYNGNTYEHEE